jgi:DNA repair exonuclease SbcCD ATPase subunit
MTHADCTRLHEQNERYEKQRFDQLEKRLAELTTALERRNTEGESRASRIHARIDELAKEASRIDGTLTNHIEHGGHNA